MDLLDDLHYFLFSKKPAPRNKELEKKAKAIGPQFVPENLMQKFPIEQMQKANEIIGGMSPWDYMEKGIPKGSLEDMFLQRQGTRPNSWL